ncbi:hypothetical protein M0R45_038175 [Rubus argutus]|uniref:F-box protein n=1 Tax=Rubus argutus TaxID=59490 RepID=A0AAW1W6B4_RUBAR
MTSPSSLGAVPSSLDHDHSKRSSTRKPSSKSNLLININIKYRYRVVRILPTLYDGKFYDYATSEFQVEIFSSETVDEVFLIGLDPFIISSHTNDNKSGDYGCRYIKLIIKDPAHKLSKLHLDYQIKYLGVPGGGGGCLQMCFLDKHENSLIVWELKEEEDFMVEPDGAQVWCSKEKRLVLNNMEGRVDLIGFDPQEEGFLYIVLNETRFVKIDVRTGSLAQEIIDVVSENISSYCFFPLRVDPSWPTPVPRLPRTSTT